MKSLLKQNSKKEVSNIKLPKSKIFSKSISTRKIQTKPSFENDPNYKVYIKKQLFLKNLDKRSEFIKSSINNLDSTFKEYSRNINNPSNSMISSNLYKIFLARTNSVQNQFSKVNQLAKSYKFKFYDSLNLSYLKENQKKPKKKKIEKSEKEILWVNNTINNDDEKNKIKHQKLDRLKDFLFKYDIEENEKKIVTTNEELEEKNENNWQSFLRKNLINKQIYKTSVQYDKMKLPYYKKYELILDNLNNNQNNNNKFEFNSKLYKNNNKPQYNSARNIIRPNTTRYRNDYNKFFNLNNKTTGSFNINKTFKTIDKRHISNLSNHRFKKYNMIPFFQKDLNEKFQKLINKTLRNCKSINKELSEEKKNKYPFQTDDSSHMNKNKKTLDIEKLRKDLNLKDGNFILNEGEIIMKNVSRMKKLLSKHELNILNKIAKTVILEDKRANKYIVFDDTINFKLRILSDRNKNIELLRQAMKKNISKEFSKHDKKEFEEIMKNEYYDFNDLESLKQILKKYKEIQKP